MTQTSRKQQSSSLIHGKTFIDFGTLKASVSMTQVLERYGHMPQLRSLKNGESLEGPCPIHKGTSPDQFKVSITKNCWNCFSDCKCGGNVLDFVARMENVDAHEAALRLNEWIKLGLDKQPSSTREDRARDSSPPKPQPDGRGGGGAQKKAPSASPPEE
ncbi:MAG: CHC2 zinc finger domain-containing protein [Verrucomicrobiales bacterium]